MPVITLSREYGSGGLRVGTRVAELLGVDCIDATLVAEVGRRLEISEEAVRRWDERREGVVLRLLRAMRASHPEYAAGGAWPEALAAGTDPEAVGRVTREVIEEVGRAGSGVIVGRGAAFVLASLPDAWHFRLAAPLEARVRNLEQASIPRAEALRQIELHDRERRAYVWHHFGVDVRDAVHYALIVNTARLGIEGSARLIVQVVRDGGTGERGV